ncbi:MAG: hypothetical protein AAFY07_07455 [Pseudomonadota bacterium]
MMGFGILPELLRNRVGWQAAAALFLVSIPIGYFVERPASELGFYTYNAISRSVGILVFAGFIFPLVRSALRGRVEMSSPRWLAWLALSIALAIFSFVASFAMVAVSYLLEIDAVLYIAPGWHQSVAEVLITPIFVAVFVWEIGLIAGRRSPSLSQVHRFVWGQRIAIVGVYFVLVLLDLAISYAIPFVIPTDADFMTEIAYSLRYAFFTWLLSLITIALYDDLVQSAPTAAEIFE